MLPSRSGGSFGTCFSTRRVRICCPSFMSPTALLKDTAQHEQHRVSFFGLVRFAKRVARGSRLKHSIAECTIFTHQTTTRFVLLLGLPPSINRPRLMVGEG